MAGPRPCIPSPSLRNSGLGEITAAWHTTAALHMQASFLGVTNPAMYRLTNIDNHSREESNSHQLADQHLRSGSAT